METAIKQAIKGGYLDEEITSVSTNYGGIWYFGTPIQTRLLSKIETEILLDPKFWQALGKAEKWNWFCNDCGEEQNVQEKGSAYCETCGLNTIWKRGWIIKWHYFIDHIAQGKDINSFFEELLK